MDGGQMAGGRICTPKQDSVAGKAREISAGLECSVIERAVEIDSP